MVVGCFGSAGSDFYYNKGSTSCVQTNICFVGFFLVLILEHALRRAKNLKSSSLKGCWVLYFDKISLNTHMREPIQCVWMTAISSSGQLHFTLPKSRSLHEASVSSMTFSGWASLCIKTGSYANISPIPFCIFSIAALTRSRLFPWSKKSHSSIFFTNLATCSGKSLDSPWWFERTLPQPVVHLWPTWWRALSCAINESNCSELICESHHSGPGIYSWILQK